MTTRPTVIKPYFVWYTASGPDQVWSFASEDEALDWQLSPKGQGYMGDKVVLHVSFRPWEKDEKKIWTHGGATIWPGPETREESLQRVRREAAEGRILKALGKKDEDERLRYVMGEVGMDALDFFALVNEVRDAKESRKRKRVDDERP